ncbi:hypothetical protein [Nakamurella leprariae]|uniref:Uncharacterized protein n=1 Tax=Nakamurella leprariae TaxID=2803911 RepID=A0A939C0Y2_9ACTN|nr:hypothetical protein [Nakamurella leprariae]MBM9469256.1 hypothetical protein [Nakamurella leprariae]
MLVVSATACWLVNCTLGLGVATGTLDTSRARWIHHAAYAATAGLTAAAGLVLAVRRDRAVVRLLPAALPLAAIPFVPARTAGHAALGASLAPAYAATLWAVRGRRPDRPA